MGGTTGLYPDPESQDRNWFIYADKNTSESSSTAINDIASYDENNMINNLGEIDLTTVLAKSSNVGMTKIALELGQQDLWTVLSDFGIGRSTTSGFPGESSGVLTDFQHWRPVGQATLSYGYGVSVTALQLARAYATVAAGGIFRPVSVRVVRDPLPVERAISGATSAALLGMLEVVVSPMGSGSLGAEGRSPSRSSSARR